MQYDLIMWFMMFTIYWFNRDGLETSLPLLINCSSDYTATATIARWRLMLGK